MDLTRPELHLDSGPPVQPGAGGLTKPQVERLREILRNHSGDSPGFVHLVSAERETVLRLDDEFSCDASTNLYVELRIAFGRDAVK
jgi:hypothetical protein